MVITKSDIGRTAEIYGLSLRTLRFYEERGLLNPIRRGVTRIYTSEDHLRIKLIVTGKRLGFSLSQIHDLIDPRSDSAPREAPDMDKPHGASILAFLTADDIQQQLQLLERQRDDMDDAIRDLQKSLEKKEDLDPDRGA